jgi:hypothetical protein
LKGKRKGGGGGGGGGGEKNNYVFYTSLCMHNYLQCIKKKKEKGNHEQSMQRLTGTIAEKKHSQFPEMFLPFNFSY